MRNSIRSAVTISLVPEARGGPFVFWGALDEGCRKAKALGFDAVEIFPPSAEAVDERIVGPILQRHDLKLAAVGTGGGWVLHKLTLTAADAGVRAGARDFIRSIVLSAARLGAPAIIGSMQGRWGDSVTREAAMGYLREALDELGAAAQGQGTTLLYEPLNRYETNLINTQGEAAEFVRSLAARNVKLLCDLYHMNIEEANLADALRNAGEAVGHVHFADSNRRPIGNGHTDVNPIARALAEIGYSGCLSAECFPFPDPDAAATQTIQSFRKFFRSE